jgi:uncharacterized protein (UPF0335 family)
MAKAQKIDHAVDESDTGGDQGAETDTSLDVLGGNSQGQLKAIVERVERLEEDKAAVAADIKEVYAEAKGNGFDVKTVRRAVRWRKQDRARRQEEEALLDLYLTALGER